MILLLLCCAPNASFHQFTYPNYILNVLVKYNLNKFSLKKVNLEGTYDPGVLAAEPGGAHAFMDCLYKSSGFIS